MLFRFLSSVFLVILGLTQSPLLSAANPVFATPEEAAADPDFAVQGEYASSSRGMQVIARAEGEFECVIYDGGLPGAGWNGQPVRRVDADAETVAELVESQQLKRLERQSPTMGATPPPGAIVLFDGSAESLKAHWQGGARRTEDGLLCEGANSIDRFQDFSLHLEFRTPFQPAARGQGRGNSGVYYQGRYETQVLDSFGLEGADNECGGIYEIRRPDLNMCLPPLTWQTYDADFTAAKFDEAGKKIADARLTVRLNGVVIHRDIALPRSTRAAPEKESPEPGILHLQNHGNPVRYRNIWVVPRDAAAEARRPIVPALERFYTGTTDPAADHAVAGRVLLNELGCVACHAGKSAPLSPHTAPLLTGIAQRVRYDAILEWLTQPRSAKTGTLMPDVLHHLPEADRMNQAAALASFLAGEDRAIDQRGDRLAARRGGDLFHQVGCVACHAAKEGAATSISTSVPLGAIEKKYTLAALTKLLLDPAATHPSGRMPRLGLTEEEARDVAVYLLQDVIIQPGSSTLRVQIYEGRWELLPDFSQLTPVETLEVSELSVAVTKLREQFALRFETFLNVPKKGKYKFHLASDDGSRILVDGKQVVEYNGIHPYGFRSGDVNLDAGVHEVIVEYFELAGEEQLTVEVEGPGLARTPLDILGTLSKEGKPPAPLVVSKQASKSELIEQGRASFVTLGCAACHQGENLPKAEVAAPGLEKLRPDQGCLAKAVPAGLPNYDLTNLQRQQIAAALTGLKADPSLAEGASPADRVHANFLAMNCYACHVRDGLGGPEANRNERFITKIPEMGEEGRLPPLLTGVGDKLNEKYLREVIDKGAHSRPYMLTRMPGFGGKNLEALVATFVEHDVKTEASTFEAKETEQKVFAHGRTLVGEGGLSCVKCHTFNQKGTPGIQAIDMLLMPERLREDWFRRYLLDPQRYRPGTRMPTSFTNGKSAITAIYDGDPDGQIHAMWDYLKQGKQAKEPLGLSAERIALQPEGRPTIYRNFIEGLTPRGIAVGFPEQVHYAWDAGRMGLSLVWRGGFIDAGKHWIGRGPGNQEPFGDEINRIDPDCPLAALESNDQAWPKGIARDRKYQFKGYRLNALGRPTFMYRTDQNVEVTDFIEPLDGKPAAGFARQLVIGKSDRPLTLRVAVGSSIESADQGFVIDHAWRVEIQGGQAKVRTSDGKQELLVEIPVGGATIQETIRW